jgi:hypothetical protein
MTRATFTIAVVFLCGTARAAAALVIYERLANAKTIMANIARLKRTVLLQNETWLGSLQPFS